MKSTDPRLIRLIALFKLLKAVLLIAVGVAALQLLHADVTRVLQGWVTRLGLGPGSRYVGRVILEAATLTPSKIKDLAVGSFVYAGLFLTEGIGLWLLKRWAEWLTVIITSSLVPVEIYQLYRHPSVAKVLVLLFNLLVVAFLLYRLRAERPGVRPASTPPFR
jgi:uncharacterized membrane protein (DUF2068 family)